MTAKEHPTVTAARRAIRRALPKLTPIQVCRLAATAELLAYGEDRGRWSLSVPSAERQPYQLGADVAKVRP